MSVDDPQNGTPEWWRDRLYVKLVAKRKDMNRLAAYYGGDHPLPEGDRRCRDLFKQFQRKARTNYMSLVADATVERLKVVGVRTGGDSTNDIDDAAWHIWQANNLDLDSQMVHGAAAQMRDAYVIVGAPAEDSDVPVITAEDPRQVITEHDPVDRRVVRAALKTWCDEVESKLYAVVYLPDGVHYFVSTETAAPDKSGPSSSVYAFNEGTVQEYQPAPQWKTWQTSEDADFVPVVRFQCKPTLDGRGRAEFEDVIDIQDRINDTVLNRLVIAKLQAYRQRWAKGIETEDENGNELDLPFVPGVDLLWAVANDKVEFGDFEQADLAPLLEAVRSDVQAIINLTGLPPHYVQGDIVNASADALAAAESRLVARVRDRAVAFGESWEQVLRLAFRWLDRDKDFGADAEMVWADPERKSDAQIADRATKAQSAGVPWRQRMEDMGYTPQQITRMESDRVADAMLAATLAPPAPPPSTPIAPVAPTKGAPLPVANAA